MKNKLYILLLLCFCLCLFGCGERFVPKPYGYFRIDLPAPTYRPFHEPDFPYSFSYSTLAEIRPSSTNLREESSLSPIANCPLSSSDGSSYWLDLYYPLFNARIHCSYKPVRHNLRELSADAQDFVFKHASKASAIPEQEWNNPEERVFGVFYELRGNTASPYQFYLTDSASHFFRAAVYFGCPPNQDSLAPVISYLGNDVQHFIESFQWQY